MTVETVMDYFTLPYHDIMDIEKVDNLLTLLNITREKFFPGAEGNFL